MFPIARFVRLAHTSSTYVYQVPEMGSQSPGAMIEMGNFVHSTKGGYMKITDDVGEFTFRKELHQGKQHKKYHQVRSGICVDDVQLSGMGTTSIRVSRRGTAEIDRVMRDLKTAHKKWESDRADATALAAAQAAVAAFQDEPEQTAAPEHGRGNGGKGLGKGGAKRHRKVLRDNIQGITKPAIRRLARRGGVKRISGLKYE